jgi:hypothetical protein
MKRLFILLLILLVSKFISAQVSVKDSSIYTPYLGFSYGYYLPAGDMADRFGNNSAAQLDIQFKTRSYWIIGLNGSYLFGRNIKESLFDSIATSTGGIISKNGLYSDVRVFERGFTVSGTLGRMFHFKRPNPNSGLIATAGIGFMQHKIRIETIGNITPQLSKEYKKGYDKLSSGLLLTESIGYLYLSNNRLVNVYFGLECMQGFTKSRRSWDYELMMKDTKKRVDILYGARIAWVLPLYKKAPLEFYTY